MSTHSSSVSAFEAAERVSAVYVKEGQAVKKNQVLFPLDSQPFRIALDNAKAALAQSVQEVESTRAAYRAAVGQMNAQSATVNLNRLTYNRYAALQTQNAIAATTVDQSRGAQMWRCPIWKAALPPAAIRLLGC